MFKKLRPFAILAAGAVLLSACGGSNSSASGDDVTLEYWMWDDTQVPLYQTCADDFTAANPEITINITQTAWGQYWQNLSTQIAAGSAPDVFVNHVSYAPQFVENNQLLDVTSQVESSDVDLTAFAENTPEMWEFDGRRYGLPKDWDTMGLLYNVEAATEAGFTAEDMNSLTWNPEDGGTFGEFVKATTIDSSGNTGLDPEFNKDDVAQYGYYPEWADGAVGQNGWGTFAGANGFTYSDEEGLPSSFNYDSPEMIETAAWLQSLIDDGYAPPFDEQSTLGTDAIMKNGNAASTIAGSWTVSTYLTEDATEFNYALVPEGPAGRAAAMNSLSDAIWAGSKHPEEAFKWVSYMASPDCQDKVGEAGTIFPALKSGTDVAMQAREEQGFDSTAFVTVVDNGETYTVPAMSNGTEIGTIIQDAMQAIAQGADPKATLEDANTQAEALFE